MNNPLKKPLLVSDADDAPASTRGAKQAPALATAEDGGDAHQAAAAASASESTSRAPLHRSQSIFALVGDALMGKRKAPLEFGAAEAQKRANLTKSRADVANSENETSGSDKERADISVSGSRIDEIIGQRIVDDDEPTTKRCAPNLKNNLFSFFVVFG